MPMRGIRGATTATENTAEAITDATEELLRELITQNDLDAQEIAFAYFTTTPDLTAVARAFGADGWLVEDNAELEPALRKALAAEGPALVHLRMDRDQLSVDRRLDR